MNDTDARRNGKRCAQNSDGNNGRTGGCCAGRPKSSSCPATDKNKPPCMTSPIVPAAPADANPCKKETPPCCPARDATTSCCPAKCPPPDAGGCCCCKATVRLDPCCTAVADKPADDSCRRRAAANDCMNCDLTDFGKQHAAKTGKLIQNCICVKFNGLQDFCTHSSCNNGKGCTDNPFPSCSPAQKWKCDFICKSRKKPDGC